MIQTGVQQPPSDDARPKGVVQPLQERAVGAVKALDDQRYPDAEAHIDAIADSEPLDDVWRLFLRALLAIGRGDLKAALPLLREVASEAPTTSRGPDPAPSSAVEATFAGPDPDCLRLAARALEKVGWIYRRQDSPRKAYDAHLCAYHIRNEHGSFEEVWESARSLGLAADLRGSYGDGQTWHRIAAEMGARADEDPEGKQAIAWTNLSASLTSSGLHDQAVEAARTARHWWHERDVGDVAAARADMKVGYALLRQGESQHDCDPTGAEKTLAEAIECLEASADALSAFGPHNSGDVHWCAEQVDFAQRLRDTLEF